MKFLITGKNGQLARAFLRRFEQQGIDHVAPEESSLDITNSAIVARAIGTLKPAIILNCAAYNLVDKAEQEREKVHAVNAAGPENLARAAAASGALIVHFGSDYVFDGLKENGLYSEQDAVNPLNEYGKSKLAGEDSVAKVNDRHLILRLSWVFGEGQQNFIHKLTGWAAGNEYLKIACDEFSVPTYTETVVDATLLAIRQGLTGRYHLTNSGFCSRYEWAKMVLTMLGIKKFIRPVSMDEFKLPATRPRFSAMTNQLLSRKLDLDIPGWEEAVGSFLQKKR